MAYASRPFFRTDTLVRFFLVGLTAAGVQQALLWSFVDVGGVNYLVGALVAIEITIIFQYVLNNLWTFHRTRHTTLREYFVGMGKTNLVRGSAIPIQLGILFALVNWGGQHYFLANAVAIALTGVYRFALDSQWTWG
jgi:putative flippase GtrA